MWRVLEREPSIAEVKEQEETEAKPLLLLRCDATAMPPLPKTQVSSSHYLQIGTLDLLVLLLLRLFQLLLLLLRFRLLLLLLLRLFLLLL